MGVVRDSQADSAKEPAHDVSETKAGALSAQDLVDKNEDHEGFASAWKSLWSKHPDLDAVATKRSVFDDEELSKFYTPPATYENAHRFDPNERWTYREERAVLRKIDFRILLWVLVSLTDLGEAHHSAENMNR